MPNNGEFSISSCFWVKLASANDSMIKSPSMETSLVSSLSSKMMKSLAAAVAAAVAAVVVAVVVAVVADVGADVGVDVVVVVVATVVPVARSNDSLILMIDLSTAAGGLGSLELLSASTIVKELMLVCPGESRKSLLTVRPSCSGGSRR